MPPQELIRGFLPTLVYNKILNNNIKIRQWLADSGRDTIFKNIYKVVKELVTISITICSEKLFSK